MNSIFNFNRPYVRNPGREFTPIYLPGETYTFYMNMTDGPISEDCGYGLHIVEPHGLTSVADISPIEVLFVAGSVGYHLYKPNFVFPLDLPDGQYYFKILKFPPDGGVADGPLSNIFTVSRKCLDTTSYVSYRHNDAIYNYRYDLLLDSPYPEFRNTFRLPINLIEAPEFSSKREEYRQASGQRELRLSKSFRDIKQKLEFYYADLNTLEALSAMLEHDDVEINGSRLILLDQVKSEPVSPFSNLIKGTFTVIVKEEPPSVYSAEGFLTGGTIGYICYSSFFVGGEL